MLYSYLPFSVIPYSMKNSEDFNQFKEMVETYLRTTHKFTNKILFLIHSKTINFVDDNEEEVNYSYDYVRYDLQEYLDCITTKIAVAEDNLFSNLKKDCLSIGEFLLRYTVELKLKYLKKEFLFCSIPVPGESFSLPGDYPESF